MITKLRTDYIKNWLICLLILTSQLLHTCALADRAEFQDSSTGALDRNELKKVIRHTKRMVLLSPHVVHDAVVKDYLQRLGQRLTGHISERVYPFHFFMVKHDAINAFATLGNYIGVHSGLVSQTQSESELAAVLAHEVAHCQQQHLMHMIQHQKDMRIPMVLGILGSIGLSVLNPAIGQGALLASTAGLEQDRINFTRGFEQEADRIGIDSLHKLHFNVSSMADFFERLRLQERYSMNQLPALLRTHPVTQSRIAQAKDYAAGVHQNNVVESIDYKFVQERLRVLRAIKLDELRQFYQSSIRKTRKHVELYYGAALTEYRLGHEKEALKLLQKIPSYKHHWIIDLARSHFLLRKSPNKALTVLRQLYITDKTHSSITTAYARALTKYDNAKKAIPILERALIDDRNNPNLWHLLAEAENRSGQKARAYFSAAHVSHLLFNNKRAIKLLKIAKKKAGKDKDLQAQIRQILRQYKKPH